MSIYYDYDKLMSRSGWLMAFVIGERGVGKSYGAKKMLLNRYLKYGEQFIYIRRYKTELDTALATFWNDIAEEEVFEDLTLKVKKSKMLTEFTCNGKVCGYAIPLSTANILKSTPFPNVATILFDEFLLDVGGAYRYLKNEITMFLETFESVFRLREGRAILLGNCLAPYSSPYFAYWNLELPYESEFKSYYDGTIIVNYIKNLEYREAKKKSRFGQLIDGTDYGRYAIDNQMYRQNNEFIGKRPSKSSFIGMLIINGMNIGIWNGRDGFWYLSEKFEPNTLHKFALDYSDHTENTIFTSVRENMYVHMCIRAYKHGFLKFENQKVKAVATAVLNKCIAIC